MGFDVTCIQIPDQKQEFGIEDFYSLNARESIMTTSYIELRWTREYFKHKIEKATGCLLIFTYKKTL